jgi:hypothetical protein
MKLNAWTLGLLGAGLVSLPAVTRAEEKPSSVLTSLSSTTLSGYVDTTAQWNMGTGDANVPGYAFGGPSKADGFNLNVVRLVLEKPVAPTEDWGAGYKVDLWMGPDANTLATQSTLSSGASDFAVKQAYVALHTPVGNGLDFKLGVWDPIMGYEVSDAPSNPNYTRSYGYTMEPVSHTGLLATYQFSDSLSASAGIANTFGPTINGRAFFGPANIAAGTQGPQAESYKAYMGAVTFTAPTNWGVLGGSTISGAVMSGYNAAVPSPNGADQTSFYIGATFNTPVSGLKVGVCYDYAGVTYLSPAPQSSGYANATGLYANYQLTEKMSLNGRAEYATSSSASTFGSRKVVETTATLQYDLWKNVLSRIEFRWDHSADGSNAYGGTVAGSPELKNSYILLADVAYKF